MRLIMTLLVRDEEDIIEQNILYHLRMGVDFIIATDNKSKDATSDILRKFEQQGVLHLIREEEVNYSQSIWVSSMAHLAREKYDADWVINNDADEFWLPISGNLSESLQRIPDNYDIVSVLRHNFLPCTVEGKVPWHEKMFYRNTHSVNPTGKPLPPKVCHRSIEGIKVSQGNHSIRWPKGLAVYPQGPIEIMHFPMRSYAQYENSIINGGSAYENNTLLPKNTGYAKRWLYDQWKNGKLEEYFQEHVYSDNQLQRGIDKGQIVLDTRLKDLFQKFEIC